MFLSTSKSGSKRSPWLLHWQLLSSLGSQRTKDVLWERVGGCLMTWNNDAVPSSSSKTGAQNACEKFSRVQNFNCLNFHGFYFCISVVGRENFPLCSSFIPTHAAWSIQVMTCLQSYWLFRKLCPYINTISKHWPRSYYLYVLQERIINLCAKWGSTNTSLHINVHYVKNFCTHSVEDKTQWGYGNGVFLA